MTADAGADDLPDDLQIRDRLLSVESAFKAQPLAQNLLKYSTFPTTPEVRRDPCPEDVRCTNAIFTDDGYAKVEATECGRSRVRPPQDSSARLRNVLRSRSTPRGSCTGSMSGTALRAAICGPVTRLLMFARDRRPGL